MNNTEYRTSTSASSEITRLMHEIENQRAQTSDFYEELRAHLFKLKTPETTSDGAEEKKHRFKRIGVILDELIERYWDLYDLLSELDGIELLESNLPEYGARLSREIIGILKEMGPTISNVYKSLRSNELGSTITDLCSLVDDKKFFELNEVLRNLSTEIDMKKLVDLKQKRIL